MNKNMALISGCILLFSTQLLADRPAMNERNAEPAMQTSAPPAIKTQNTAPSSGQTKNTAQVQSTLQTGDRLELQSGETLSINALDFPRRGMTMDKVKNEMGEPIEISPAVGEPPITRWSYGDRTVYFEHSWVIHAVANH